MEEKKFFIPPMDEVELVSHYQHISPIVQKNGTSFFLRRLSTEQLSKKAYTWLNAETDYGEEVDYNKLEVMTTKSMLHTFGYYGFFKPSVAEVIRQIPKELLDQTVAFEIVYQPKDAEELERAKDAMNAGFHISAVRLYKAK